MFIENKNGINGTISLKEVYKDYFLIGAAVEVEDLEDGLHRQLLLKHFNSLTAENAMKFERIHPKEDEFNFKDADKIVEFAMENNLKVRGHTFVWHNQTPEWVFKDKTGNEVSKELLLERLKFHINTVCNHYKNKIYAWDVVNEAIEDKEDYVLRKSPWYRIIGKEYVELAFKFVREADPEVELYYNDYNNEKPYKLYKTYDFLKSLLDKGIPIDGIGIQGHWDIYDEGLFDNLKRAIELYASLGLKIQITELDISMFEFENKTREVLIPTAEMLEFQALTYKKLFEIFRSYKGIITSVTFWGISDKHTWKDNFPVKGRKDWPLLFDEKQNPKKAFFEIVDF